MSFVLLSLICAAEPMGEILTNEKILLLVEAGFSEQLILRKIEESDCDFEISASAMVDLKKQKVSEPVIAAMMDAQKRYAERKRRVVEQLIQTLRGTEPQQYALAVRKLVRAGPTAVPRLLRHLDDEDPVIRAGSCEVLGKILDRAALPSLFEMLRDSHPAVRAQAALALSKMRSQASTERLLQMMEEPGMPLDGVARALGYSGDRRAYQKLLRLFETPGPNEARAAAGFALGALGETRALDALVATLVRRSTDPRVRDSCAMALAKLVPLLAAEERTTVLDAMLKAFERYHASRAVLARELRAFNEERAVTALVEALKDHVRDVSVAAWDSLKYVTAEEIPRDYDQWTSWWQLQRRRWGLE